MNEVQMESSLTLTAAAELGAEIIMKSGILGAHVARSIKGEQMHAQALKEAILANLVQHLPSIVK